LRVWEKEKVSSQSVMVGKVPREYVSFLGFIILALTVSVGMGEPDLQVLRFAE